MDILAIVFWNILGIYVVNNMDPIFMTGYNSILEDIGNVQDKKNEAFCRCNGDDGAKRENTRD